MALTVGTDSYISLAAADAYFVNRPYATAWTGEADDTVRENALRMATIRLDFFEFYGDRVSTSQALAFPRNGIPLIDGVDYSGSTIPSKIEKACAEAALVFIQNDPTATNTDVNYKRVKLSSMEVEYNTGQYANLFNTQMNPFVYGYLKGFIMDSSGVVHG